MSKLLSFKEWITLKEAATYLSGVFKEDVLVADLFRFALAGKIQLSAHFVNPGSARFGRRMLIRDAGFKVSDLTDHVDKKIVVDATGEKGIAEFQAWLGSNEAGRAALQAPEQHGKLFTLDGEQIGDTSDCLRFGDNVFEISGLWSLAMLGAECLDVEHALQNELGGPSVKLTTRLGVILKGPDGGYAGLMEPLNKAIAVRERTYMPAFELPSDVPLVVRPSDLFDFVDAVNGRRSPDLDPRERTTLLTIIGALATDCRLDLSQPYKVGDAIKAMLPGSVRISARTIGEHLKEISEAMGSRSD